MEKIIIPLKKGQAKKFLKHLKEEHPKYSREAFIQNEGKSFGDEMSQLTEEYKGLNIF